MLTKVTSDNYGQPRESNSPYFLKTDTLRLLAHRSASQPPACVYKFLLFNCRIHTQRLSTSCTG